MALTRAQQQQLEAELAGRNAALAEEYNRRRAADRARGVTTDPASLQQATGSAPQPIDPGGIVRSAPTPTMAPQQGVAGLMAEMQKQVTQPNQMSVPQQPAQIMTQPKPAAIMPQPMQGLYTELAAQQQGNQIAPIRKPKTGMASSRYLR